jgi:holo-[acyl-carrier protein] synthase
MIIGIGSDLVYIPRIAETYKNQGERFLNRCFALPEIEYVLSSENAEVQAGRLAKRWAAKEAVAKALGTGIAQFVSLKDIYVINDDNGRPIVLLENTAKDKLSELAKNKGTPKIHLSLTDEANYAQAFVVLSAERD